MQRRSNRNWQPCRVCGDDHTNPQSSSICPACGAVEAAARNADAYTDADRFRGPNVAEKLEELFSDAGGREAFEEWLAAFVDARTR